MQKLILMAGFISVSTFSMAQTWNTDATNIGTSSSALGVSNAESLRFKTNGTEWFSISPTGNYFFNSLSGVTDGIFGITSDGKGYKINFTGNSNDVLRGDGTFSPLSGNNSWSVNGNVLFSDLTKNVAIGTNIAPEKLTVAGNIIASGSISGTSLNVIDIVTTGKEFKISTSICMKGFDANEPNSRNEICGMNGPLFIQSESGNDNNTVLNYGNTGKVGIGVMPTEGFHVGVTARFDAPIYTDKIYTNRITSEDSIIHIGDSSLLYNQYLNKISWTNMAQLSTPGNPLPTIRGLAIGRGNTSLATGNNSIAIGTNVKVDGNNSIVIGSGYGPANSLLNTENNSLMIGFNSNIPTLTVTASSGIGKTGNVGIGTSNPDSKLTVHVDADPLIGGYGILSTSNVPTVKSISVIHKDLSNSIDQENFIVYADGRVFCREVFVKLGQLGDFVFDEDYNLMNYHDLENYLKTNKHLPGVPSEPEVISGGLNVGEMQAKVLQKTEENTLYILDLNKRLEQAQVENAKLKSDLEEMKRRHIEIENKLNDILSKK